MRFLRHDGDRAAPASRRGRRDRSRPSSVTGPRPGAQHAGQQPQQRRLARSVRPEDADQAAARHVQRHAVQAGRPAVRYANVTSAACSNADPDHDGAAERREPERLLVAPVEQVVTRPNTSTARDDAPGRAGVDDREPGVVNRPPNAPQVGSTSSARRAAADARERRQRGRACSVRSSDAWWRGRRSSGSPTANGGGATSPRCRPRGSRCRGTCSRRARSGPTRARPAAESSTPCARAFEMLSVR